MSAPTAFRTPGAGDPGAGRRPSPGPGALREVRIVAAVPSTSLPDDLLDAARATGARRQVTRFLDGMALPAFVAGAMALDAAAPVDGERCGVFTASGWDPDQHQPDIGDEPATYSAVARHYIATASPVAWLRKMVNNALCQLSLTYDLRGPNNHVVGGPAALDAVLTLAGRSVATGVADHVLVVAYDAPRGHESDHEVAGTAAAVVLGAAPTDAATGGAADASPDGATAGALPPPGTAAGAAPGARAVDVLDAIAGGHGHAR